tara:strand:+ start:6992 stop:7801 length:810 start_codon:yes stop_codon:yes gene_type:complete
MIISEEEKNRIKKLHEATSTNSSGSYETPMFGQQEVEQIFDFMSPEVVGGDNLVDDENIVVIDTTEEDGMMNFLDGLFDLTEEEDEERMRKLHQENSIVQEQGGPGGMLTSTSSKYKGGGGSNNDDEEFNIWDKFLYWGFNIGKMKELEDEIKKAQKKAEDLRKEYEVARDENGEVILKPGITSANNYNFLKGHCMRFCEMSEAVYKEFMNTHPKELSTEKNITLLMKLIEGLEVCEFDEMHKGALGPKCNYIKKDLELMLKLLGYERK